MPFTLTKAQQAVVENEGGALLVEELRRALRHVLADLLAARPRDVPQDGANPRTYIFPCLPAAMAAGGGLRRSETAAGGTGLPAAREAQLVELAVFAVKLPDLEGDVLVLCARADLLGSR